MPEILIASCPPVGHVSPLLNVARGLVARGDRVTFLTSARHAGKITRSEQNPVRCRSASAVRRDEPLRGSVLSPTRFTAERHPGIE